MHGFASSLQPKTPGPGAACQCVYFLAVMTVMASGDSPDVLLHGLSADGLLLSQALGKVKLQSEFQPSALRGSTAQPSSSDQRPVSDAATWVSQEITAAADVPGSHKTATASLVTEPVWAQMDAEQARVEAARATAEEAAAEAIAVKELRKANRAAARAKAAWAKVRSAEAEALKLSVGFQKDARSLDSISLAALSDSESAVALEAQPRDVATLDQPSTTILNFTGESSDGCNHGMSLIPCQVQRVLTFDYRVQMGSGCLEWVGLIAVWIASLYFVCCLCECGHMFSCLCQCMSCGLILFVVLCTANGWLRAGT